MWRKVLQVCKKHFAYSVFFCFFAVAYAQSSAKTTSEKVSTPTFPSMPSISSISSLESPVMPKINAPSFGTKFYTPGMINTNISNGNENSEAAKLKQNTVMIDKTNVEDAKKSVSSVNKSLALDYLSANDVSSLGTNGLFDGIYSLFGNSSEILNKYSANDSNSNAVLLNSIIEQLAELKEETKKNTNAIKKVSIPVTISGSGEKNGDLKTNNLTKFYPSILRFVINGCNLKDTIRTVYFSKKENDGSFLLTGDRKYIDDEKTRSETFYFLFRADGNCGTLAGYYVEPELIQDNKNEKSILYELSKKPKLKAQKTGNLVSVKYQGENWNLDFLLDIGED